MALVEVVAGNGCFVAGDLQSSGSSGRFGVDFPGSLGNVIKMLLSKSLWANCCIF